MTGEQGLKLTASWECLVSGVRFYELRIIGQSNKVNILMPVKTKNSIPDFTKKILILEASITNHTQR